MRTLEPNVSAYINDLGHARLDRYPSPTGIGFVDAGGYHIKPELPLETLAWLAELDEKMAAHRRRIDAAKQETS